MTDKVLVLRTCDEKMQGYNGFQWPENGPIAAPEWDPEPECGMGLHGLLWGQGNFEYLNHAQGAWWLAVEVEKADIAEKNGKVKFSKGVVVYRTQSWWEAFAYVRSRRPNPQEAGAFSDAKKGHASSTGNSGHASSTGYYGHASSTGYSGHASSTGKNGHASSTGYSGHASSTGYSGHASSTGDYGIAAALGRGSCVRSSNTGALVAAWWDAASKRSRVAVAYPGEDGIKPETWYRVDEAGKFIEVV